MVEITFRLPEINLALAAGAVALLWYLADPSPILAALAGGFGGAAIAVAAFRLFVDDCSPGRVGGDDQLGRD